MSTSSSPSWLQSKILLGMPFKKYIRASIIPFNITLLIIICIGIPITWIRFSQGLAAVTNLDNSYPWGLWIGFDVLCGVALAAGGFIIASAVHIFKLKEFYPILRPAILTGFLGYFFVVVGLLFDLGHPLRLPYPVVWSFGVTSVMFLVAWHVFLYLTVQFLEFAPAIFEWLGKTKLRKLVVKITIAATVFGVILSTLHQSALGALFLLAPNKLHPLWYSAYIPVFFFISAIAAGISMVILETTISHKVFHSQVVKNKETNYDKLILNLGQAASIVLFTYFCLKWLGVAHGHNWHLLTSEYGQWFLIEIIGFVLIPCIIYAWGVKESNVSLVKIASITTILGIVLNRLNVSMIAYNWQLPYRYTPSWMELTVTIMIITLGLATFRWIVNRMPVLYVHPNYPMEK